MSFEIINFSQYFFRFLTNLLIDNYTAIGNEGYFYNKKVCNIYNGIDSCNYLPRKSSAKINFIFVGNNAQRHGLRRLIATFKKSNNKRLIKKVHINFVGKFHKDEQLFLSNELRRINVSFKFFGYLVGSELVKVLKISNYGIGNLGFFSENIKFTSALKERMYISHMIPFVYSGKDKNLSKFKKLALKVPNSNQALNLKKILEHKKKFYELKKIKISRLRIDLETSFNWPNTLKSTDELFKKL